MMSYDSNIVIVPSDWLLTRTVRTVGRSGGGERGSGREAGQHPHCPSVGPGRTGDGELHQQHAARAGAVQARGRRQGRILRNGTGWYAGCGVGLCGMVLGAVCVMHLLNRRLLYVEIYGYV